MNILNHHGVVKCPFSQKTAFKFLPALVAFVFIIILMASCNSINNSGQVSKNEQIYIDSINLLKNQLEQAYAQIEILKYPADQRLNKAKSLMDAGDLDDALNEIYQLKNVFPDSKEATLSETIVNKINDLKEAKRKEEERIKALGYKAIAEQTTIKVDYNTIVLSSISVGNTFVFDSYGDRYYYRDADRGNKYVTMQMAVTSTDHDPDLPQLAAYSINGDKMQLIGKFDTEFARWKDYGAYLGNYHDSSNDFAKVSTVRFKLGLQISNEVLAGPYAIVLMKKNVLSSHYDRFSNPPKSYIGSADYPTSLNLDSFKDNYVLIKRFNLK